MRIAIIVGLLEQKCSKDLYWARRLVEQQGIAERNQKGVASNYFQVFFIAKKTINPTQGKDIYGGRLVYKKCEDEAES